MDRRSFVRLGAVSLAQMSVLGCRRDAPPTTPTDAGKTEPAPSPATPEVAEPKTTAPKREVVLDGLLEVPAGFTAIVLQHQGDLMSDEHAVAAQPDGMACLEDDAGRWVLLRNHELGGTDWLSKNGIPYEWFKGGKRPRESYAKDVYGGVSRVVLDPTKLGEALQGGEPKAAILSSNAIFVGTDRNCAGGMVDLAGVRGWVTCEESDEPNHGWAFLSKLDDEALVPAKSRRLDSWGRFKREAVTIDPTTGVAYMTEDHQVGLFYRHVPSDPTKPFGKGKVEALAFEGIPHTDPNLSDPKAEPFAVGTTWAARWVAIGDPAAKRVACREQGAKAKATAFNRVEGITRNDAGEVFFIASTAGPLQAGQIFKYDPATESVTLISQVDDRTVLSMPDNVTVSPWGDLVVAEDNYDALGGADFQHVRGLRSDGSVYDILRNLHNGKGTVARSPGAEFAGVCFSPDGQVMFVNIQSPENVTLAITGDWDQLRQA